MVKSKDLLYSCILNVWCDNGMTIGVWNIIQTWNVEPAPKKMKKNWLRFQRMWNQFEAFIIDAGDQRFEPMIRFHLSL